jgi:hypothetical protein
VCAGEESSREDVRAAVGRPREYVRAGEEPPREDVCASEGPAREDVRAEGPSREDDCWRSRRPGESDRSLRCLEERIGLCSLSCSLSINDGS